MFDNIHVMVLCATVVLLAFTLIAWINANDEFDA